MGFPAPSLAPSPVRDAEARRVESQRFAVVIAFATGATIAVTYMTQQIYRAEQEQARID